MAEDSERVIYKQIAESVYVIQFQTTSGNWFDSVEPKFAKSKDAIKHLKTLDPTDNLRIVERKK